MWGWDADMGMDEKQDCVHYENGPTTYSSRLDNETPIETLATPATPSSAVVRGTYHIIQRSRKKRTHAYRLYGLLETTQVEIVSNT
jgi:hypothetical protein